MTETVNPKVEETPAGNQSKPANNTHKFSRILQRVLHERPLMLIMLITILAIFMTIFYPEAFPKPNNFAAVLLDTAQGGILATGMMIMLVSGVFDLSVGSTLAFAGIVAGIMVKDWGLPPLAALIGGVLTGTTIGAINGLVITKLRINAFITTLAMQGILRGVTQLVSASGVANLPESFKPFGQTVVAGLQSPFWVMIIVAALTWFAMSRMRYFRQFYYVGANAKAAALSGIKVDKVLLVGFIIMGTMAGLAGTLLASRLSNAVVLAGTGTELRAITAGLLGGASLSGGAGTIPGAILGVIFVSLINNALIIARVPVFWQSIVVGIVLLVAIGVDQLSRRKQ